MKAADEMVINHFSTNHTSLIKEVLDGRTILIRNARSRATALIRPCNEKDVIPPFDSLHFRTKQELRTRLNHLIREIVKFGHSKFFYGENEVEFRRTARDKLHELPKKDFLVLEACGSGEEE